MLKKFSLIFGTAALATLIVAPLQADTVSACVGLNTSSCGAGQQVDTGNGAVAYTSTTNPDYSMISITGSGTPPTPEPSLNLISLDVTSSSSAATSLTVELTETGLTSLTSPYNFSESFAAILTNGTPSVSIKNYISSSNTAYATTTLIGTFSSTSAGASSLNTFSGPQTFTTPFSETEVITFGFNGNGETAFADDSITPSPEPMSLGLLGGGLAALGILRLRKSRKA